MRAKLHFNEKQENFWLIKTTNLTSKIAPYQVARIGKIINIRKLQIKMQIRIQPLKNNRNFDPLFSNRPSLIRARSRISFAAKLLTGKKFNIKKQVIVRVYKLRNKKDNQKWKEMCLTCPNTITNNLQKNWASVLNLKKKEELLFGNDLFNN